MFEENPKKEYYLFMDGMRGAAILWVMLHHIYLVFGIRSPWHYINEFCRLGYLGVDMFFVISGFLITGLLTEDLAERPALGRFYLRRFFKIVPQYYFAVGVALALFFSLAMFSELRSVYPPRLAFANFFFVQNYVTNIRLLEHTWSLAIEEHFYLVYPLIVWTVFFCIKQPSRRRDVMSLICCLLIVAVNAGRFWAFRNPTDAPFEPSLAQQTLLRVDALFFGCCLKFQSPRLMKLANRHLGLILKILGTLGFLYFVVFNFYTDDWYAYTLAYLSAGCLLAAGLRGFPGLFAFPLLRWVGKSSYGIYLWHYILAWLFYPRYFLSHNNVLWVLAYIAAAIFAGWLSTVTIERWSLNLRRKLVP